jgi:outer membrane protein assembly factor BamD (BamD/ComL family)
MDQQRCDVARITLRTLVNTYPDSKYALDAEDALRTDPRLQPREIFSRMLPFH